MKQLPADRSTRLGLASFQSAAASDMISLTIQHAGKRVAPTPQ